MIFSCIKPASIEMLDSISTIKKIERPKLRI